ncbi:hypothetical protein KC992_01735 [Candidatus Saccharibacteria bacterium]|nr:hypothetical protein [Candidatus Saccharibacteria bacterium]MCA9328795.1 hypothetical protein [Candidatus Saccharibacteria bacterium]
MIAALILIVIPVLLFVLGFLYETYISFKRLFKPTYTRESYVSATWEVTHTILIFAVVMLLMLFTQVLDELASAIFLSTLLAGSAMLVRAICYLQIFYVRKKQRINWVDWVFALSHVVTALFLVVTVVKALWFLYQNNPPVNSQFIPVFIPGLIVVLGLVSIPMMVLYKTKK